MPRVHLSSDVDVIDDDDDGSPYDTGGACKYNGTFEPELAAEVGTPRQYSMSADDAEEEHQAGVRVSSQKGHRYGRGKARDGTAESLSPFLEQQVVVQPDAEVLRERRRRVHHGDDHFRMMHILKHGKLGMSLACMTACLALLVVGACMEGSAWYQEVPVSLPGRAHRHRFPDVPGWIGPRYRFSHGEDETLQEWRGKCSYAQIREDAEDLLVNNKVFRRMVQEAGCRDSNRVECFLVRYGHNEFGEVEDMCHMNEDRCMITCPGGCKKNPALETSQLLKVMCDFRHALVDRMRDIFDIVLLVMATVVVSMFLLLCCKFKTPVMIIATLLQGLACAALVYIFLEISHSAMPKEDYLDLLEAMRTETPTGDPYVDAWCVMTEAIIGPHGTGLRTSKQSMFLIASACVTLTLATLSTVGWVGEINGFGDACAANWLLWRLFKLLMYIIFYLPLLCMWRCCGLRCSSCQSNWTPEEYRTSYKELGKKSNSCFGIAIHSSLARVIADARSFFGHFLRTLEWDAFLYDAQIASDQEKERMEEEGIVNVNVQNYLAWRRSVLVVVVAMGLIHVPWSPRKVVQTLIVFRESEVLRATPNTFQEFVLYEQFKEYRDSDESEQRALDLHAAAESAPSTFWSDYPELSQSFTTLLDVVAEMEWQRLARNSTSALAHRRHAENLTYPIEDDEWREEEQQSLALWHAERQLGEAKAEVQPGNATANLTEAEKRTQLFIKYLKAQAFKSVALLQLGMQKVGVYESTIIAITELTALAGALVAHSAWMHLPTSRDWVLFSWLLLIFSPFVITFVPASLFIDSAEVETLIARVVQETLEFFSVDAVIRECWQSVKTSFENIHSGRNLASTICGTTHSITGIGRWLFGLQDLEEACLKWEQVDAGVDWKKTEKWVGRVCVALTTSIYGGQNDLSSDSAFNENKEMSVKYFNEVRHRIGELFQGLVSLQFAALKILALIPSVLAMCPALIMAAYKFRLLMPLSSMPVIFMVGLPVINCPLAWTKYCLVWQLFPYTSVLIGMFFMSFGMLAWPIQSVMYRMHEPMSRPHLNRNMKKIMAIQMLFMLLSPLALLYALGSWLVEEDDPQGLRAAVSSSIKAVLQAPPWEAILLFFLKFIFDLWMSKVAAYDYIVQQVTAEHEFATSVEQMHDFRQQMGHRFRANSELSVSASSSSDKDDKKAAEALRNKMQMIDGILNLVHESTQNLDQLVELEAHSDVTRFH